MSKYCIEEKPYINEKLLFKYSDLVEEYQLRYFINVKFLLLPDELEEYLDFKLDCYSASGKLWFFELEDDDSAKLLFELGEYK